MQLITLMTDFGLSDTYVGVMKGVILGIAPSARLVDLTHEIAPQNLLEASARLEAAIPYFLPETLHLVVVDPGVGTERAVLVVETECCRFVAPDNGVLTLPLRRFPARRVVRLDDAARRYFRQPVSATFHGRDVFAPIAAHLAAGVSPESLGENVSPESLVTLPIDEPQTGHDAEGRPTLHLHVLYADRFGNLITDLTTERWAVWEQEEGVIAAEITVAAGGKRWQGLARTFAEVPIGSPLAYWGSAERLEIAVRNGDAARTLGLSPGDPITLTWTGRDA
ncbi:MAG TPA: SAM-dependent chlorinase/fluorinase [Chthonomonadaceae bacterium]|nr:SAM-dependent chlorinase/fluorinase [Chthonomonadaceae bacterium]